MNETERQPILKNSSTTFTQDQDLNENILIQEKTQENTQINIYPDNTLKLSDDEIKKYQNLFFLLSIIIFLLLLAPQSFIFKYIPPSNKLTFFMKFGWTLTIPTLTMILSITYSWLHKEKILKIENYFAHVVFSIFLIAVIQLTILVGLRYSNLLVSLIIMLLNGNIFLLILNNIPICWDKPYSKFFAVTAYCLLHYVFHCIFFEKNFVGFFILAIIFLLYFVYMIAGVKKLIMQLEEEKMLEGKDRVSDVRVLLFHFVIMPLDTILFLMNN
jgi:hypothetical protein